VTVFRSPGRDGAGNDRALAGSRHAGRGAVLALPLFVAAGLAACTRAEPGLDEISRIWRSTAPVDDSYDSRCNEDRMAVTKALDKALQRGLARNEVVRLLGEPDLPPHSETEEYGADNLNYSLGLCEGDYVSFIVVLRQGRSVEGRVRWS
jgi:hypothetical protein